MNQIIVNNISEIISLCKKHKVKSISLFGSATTDSFSEKSDLDFLVEFKDELQILDYADNYFSFKEELEKITGRKIDLLSIKYLKNPVLREEIYKSKIDLYAA